MTNITNGSLNNNFNKMTFNSTSSVDVESGNGIKTSRDHILDGKQGQTDFHHKVAKFLLLALVALALLALVIALPLHLHNRDEEATFQKAAVTANGKECAGIGKDILERGGTVADAAIATLFCEGVTCSQCMGLGGGFLLTMYIRANQTVRILDAREVAPGASFEGMFEEGNISTTTGGMAVGVPGELRGYEALYNTYGSLPWAELVEPAIQLCQEGFEITEYLARALKEREQRIQNEPTLRRVFINPETNSTWLEGDKVKRPVLAQTLEIIARDGPNAFYEGTLAEHFVADVQERGGILTLEDLKNYKPTWLDPVAVQLEPNTVFTVPLPGSGELLSFMINTLKEWVFLDVETGSTTYWHRIMEVFKYAYAYRTRLGDRNFLSPEYINPILANLTSTEYAHHIQTLIADDVTYNDWKHYGADFGLIEDHGTAHISVLAPNGDAISVTSTVNFVLGAFFMSNSTGIIPNNEMDDFSIPGVTNVYGLPPSPANFIKPGKKPLSSMVPVIVVDQNGDVRMALGAAGGTKITTQVALVILKHLQADMPLKAAIDQPRLHHQLFPMAIQHESDFDTKTLGELKTIGHETSELGPTAGFAAVTGLSVSPKTGLITACYDKRRIGSVAGF